MSGLWIWAPGVEWMLNVFSPNSLLLGFPILFLRGVRMSVFTCLPEKNGKRGMLGRVGVVCWLLCFYVDVQCFFLTIDVFCAGDFGTILPRTFTSLFGLRWGGELLLLLKFYVPWVCFFWSVASPLDILIKFFVQIAWAPRPSELGRECICQDAYSCKML